jgi:hypothetical protein
MKGMVLAIAQNTGPLKINRYILPKKPLIVVRIFIN